MAGRLFCQRFLPLFGSPSRSLLSGVRHLSSSFSASAVSPFPQVRPLPEGLQRLHWIDQRADTSVSSLLKETETVFSEQEMSARMHKLRNQMATDSVDAVLFSSIQNIAYYSGFVYCAFGRPYGLLITPDSATVISAMIDAHQPWRRGSMNVDGVIYTDWVRDGFFHGVWAVLGKYVRGDKRIRLGVEFDHMTIENQKKVMQAAGDSAELIDIAPATMRMRMVKSAEEIALIKIGAACGDVGGAAAKAAIAEDVSEYEVAMASTQAMTREIARRVPKAELMDTWTWFQSGINTDGAHNPVTNRRLRRGDVLSLNCFPMIQGYYTALERTLFLGEPSKEALKVWEGNVTVHKRGLELIRPGAKCSEIAAELNTLFAELGLLQYRSFGYGHSFGVLSHYYGREAGLEIREDVDTVLQPGMVVSMEPMVTLPESHPAAGGYREHDILVVGEEGAENVTKFPFGPEHNIVL